MDSSNAPARTPRAQHMTLDGPQMQAAVLTAPGSFSIESRLVSPPRPGHVRIKLSGCGVSASNIPPFEGRNWFNYPLEPGDLGHEGWGVIDAIGEGVNNVRIGDHVAALSVKAYATHDHASADAIIKLPKILAGKPFPGEPLGCAMNIFDRSDIRHDQTVAIIGAGFLGCLLTSLVHRTGARTIVISRRPFSLEMARAFGADHTIEMRDNQEILDRVMELTDGQGCERVIEAVGKQWPLDLATQLTCIRGRLIIAGLHQDGPRRVDMQLWNWRGLDVINAHERHPRAYLRGMRQAIDAVANGRLDPTPLYTHEFPLHELTKALEATRDRPPGFMKALIRYA